MKYLVKNEVDAIKFVKLKKGARSMISSGGRLYRADDDLFIADRQAADAMLIYPIDSSQPMLCHKKYVDPDMTRALIESAKISGTKKKTWLNLDSSQIWKVLAGVALVGSILYGVMIYGI